MSKAIINDIRQHRLKELNSSTIFLNAQIKEKLKNIQIEEKIRQQSKEIWQIEIPKINLIANIGEGTTEKILNKYVGHFENTKFYEGNIGLAAHNRGYPVNYFANIEDLKIGDKIKYRINCITKNYKISNIKSIKDTDWLYLENTKTDTITLITCIKNKPELRLCVQGIIESEEIKNEKENSIGIASSDNIIKYNIIRGK